jgi:hypothetical protein
MARDQASMADDDIKNAKAQIEDLRGDVREALAEDLGDDPDDYRADRVARDGGE